MADPVWVLTIDHEHGTDLYVCKTQEIARKHLVGFVESWWSYEFEGEDDPKCPVIIYDSDIELYFERTKEYYSIRIAYVIEE